MRTSVRSGSARGTTQLVRLSGRLWPRAGAVYPTLVRGPPRLGGGKPQARRADVLRSRFALRKPHAGGAPAPPPPSQERHSPDDVTKSAAAPSAFRPRRREPES